MVVAPFCFKDTEWTGFTLVVAIDRILKSLPMPYYDLVQDSVSLKLHHPNHSKLRSNSDVSIASKVSSAVVYIQASSSWGSGVIVDHRKGLIITCSHVVHSSFTESKGNPFSTNHKGT